jgi:hypothetical protein
MKGRKFISDKNAINAHRIFVVNVLERDHLEDQERVQFSKSGKFLSGFTALAGLLPPSRCRPIPLYLLL